MMVSLDGQWRFHPGDDAGWADPNFDDSQWPLISSTEGWGEQGYKNMSGLAWYRVRIVIPEGGRPLALYVPDIDTSCQIYADGQMIGEFGGMPPHPRAYPSIPQTFRIPASVSAHAHAALIAIRVWHWPVWSLYYSGGLQGGIYAGRADLIDRYSALRADHTEQRSFSVILFAVLMALAGLTALALFAFRPREQEYLWFGVAQLVAVALSAFGILTRSFPVSITVRDHIFTFLGTLGQLLFVGFYIYLLRARPNWFFWLAISIIGGFDLFSIWVYVTWPISVATYAALGNLASLPIVVWVDVLIIRRAIEGYPDARLVLVPQLIADLWGEGLAMGLMLFQMGWSKSNPSNLDYVWQHPFPIPISLIVGLLFLLAMLAILIRRFARTSLHEERMAGEFEAARTVQQVLIPDEIPEVPGFAVEAVYKPASEVGGDFFQIIPAPNGGVLAVIGDVSGKGMRAAMTVSLLVGTVRTLAHYTQCPEEILRAMNQRMLGRSQCGFTTCLVLHVEADGAGRVANAGHLPPYIDGTELEVEGGLPLGLSADSTYPESAFQLDPDRRLALMTDGVVEARNRSGELFGFERAQTIAMQSPASIASKAQAFGQQDDITVVTLSLAALPVLTAHA